MKKHVTRKKVYGKLIGVCKGMLFAAGLFTGALTGLLWKMEALAGEMIQVVEFGVIKEGESIFARCAYRHFDGSSGIMQLYLEKMDEEGDFLPISYGDLFAAGEEIQTACTQSQSAEPGIYRAVLLIRSGTGMPVVRFRDSAPFEVKHAEHVNGQEAEGFREAAREQRIEQENGPCGHVVTENTVREATPFSDAVKEESCENCGWVFARFEVPNSAYTAFLDQTADAIRAAQPQEVVRVSTDRWISFDRRVFAAMADRRDVSVLVEYRYQGKEHQVLIQAGAETDDLMDENGFCGFCHLTQVFGEKFDVVQFLL